MPWKPIISIKRWIISKHLQVIVIFLKENAVNYTIIESNKMARKEYLDKFYWGTKTIHREYWKRLKFEPTEKMYINK